ncbi:MAG: hypothetical protein IJ437_03440 [Clostridia bacterium]|nr:hypothetical protein [Clostridia bacterium]
MLFDLPHILYMVFSGIVTAGILITASFLIKKQTSKDWFLRFWAIITVVIHFSSIYYDYFIVKIEHPELELSMFIPAFACNVCMWLLVIYAFANKENKFMKLVSHFLALGGIVCGAVGILLNEAYDRNGLTDFDTVKGLLSHSTMLVGCIYIMVGKYVKIRVHSVFGVACGLLILLVDGAVVNALNKIFDMPSVNSMYLEGAPFDNMPYLNTITIGIVGIVATFLIGVIVEFFSLEKNDRWYSKIRKNIDVREEDESIKGEGK